MHEMDSDRAHFLIVDGEPHTARAVRSAVEALGLAATAVGSLRDARRLLAGERYTALIVETLLPDGSGLELVRLLREQHVQIPVLVISGSLDPNIANRAHLLRASCVFKPDIVANVSAFVERAIAGSGELTRRTMAAVREVSASCGLTGREHEILELVAFGVPRERLAIELGVSENTLKTHVRSMLQKCNETRIESLARAVLDQVVALSTASDAI
jgi:DNA-binding NarL/FixJ family response regulator